MSKEYSDEPLHAFQWQPIETAPKNQSILVHWQLASPYDQGLITVSLFTDDNHSPGEDKATHWMPLPEPPSKKKG
jgi:hypothetical protein